MKSYYYSPLRYPGGKASLYNFLVKALEINNINYGVYAEGFAGGAGAALTLLMQEDVGSIYLNDVDFFVYSFWWSVLNDTEELSRLIYDTVPNVNDWDHYSGIYSSFLKTENSSISKTIAAFAAFYLNRCNRSGILSAGPIGGKDQRGKWKIDARFNKAELINRIQKVALYKDRIKVTNYDIIKFLRWFQEQGHSPESTLIYLDPPYVEQGEQLYKHFFNYRKHSDLAKYLQLSVNYKWIVSYDDVPSVHLMYKQVRKNILEFNYFANRTKIGKELIMSSKGFLLPNRYEHYSKVRDVNIVNNLIHA
jgi:DNA adenine methylase